MGWTQSDGRYVYSQEVLLSVLVSQKEAKCCFGCLRPKKLRSKAEAAGYLKRMKFWIFQFIIVMGVTGIITMILIGADSKAYVVGSSKNKSVWLYSSIFRSISSMLALIYLLNISKFVHNIPEMKDYKVELKFLLIKLTLILTEFQPLIIAIFAETDLIASTHKYSVEDITNYTNTMLLCSEMIVISFLQLLVYPLSDYDSSPNDRKSFLTSMTLNPTFNEKL